MNTIIKLTNPYSWGLFFLGLIFFGGAFWKMNDSLLLFGQILLAVTVLVHFVLW